MKAGRMTDSRGVLTNAWHRSVLTGVLGMTVASLCLGACTPPTEELVAQVRAGDLPGVLPRLASLPADHELAAWRELALDWQALDAERRAVRGQERKMLLDAARAALDRDDPGGAVPSVAAGLTRDATDAEFLALAAELEARAATSSPQDAASIYTALAELHRGEPERAAAARVAAAEQELVARYTAEQLEGTRTSQEGIVWAGAEGVLAQVDREYLVDPDWRAMEAAGRRQLRWLAAQPAVQEAWPETATWVVPDGGDMPPTDLKSTLRLLRHVVDAGMACGVPEETLLDEWVRGALGALDPWTRAVWPAEIASWSAYHSGVTVGVGLLWREHEGGVYVDRPELDSPAWKSPIHQGDRLLAFEDARGAFTQEALPAEQRLVVTEAAMGGEPGTEVALRLQRGEEEAYDVRLVRAGVAMPTLRGVARGEDNAWELFLDRDAGLAYVRILAFRDYTEPDFDALLEPVLDEVYGVVIDLRGNPGGDVDSAVQIADRFVADGWLCQISGRVLPETGPDTDPETGEPLAAWNQALTGHALEGTPVVVLVDADSASAAEVLAGSLQERADAVVVGAPTWGKGYAQALRTDEGGRFALQLTNLVWTLPSGRRLARELDGGGGVVPDVELVLSPAEDFQADLLSRQRAALRSHADGTPLIWTDTVVREDLPPLSEDPALLAAELVMRAALYQDREG